MTLFQKNYCICIFKNIDQVFLFQDPPPWDLVQDPGHSEQELLCWCCGGGCGKVEGEEQHKGTGYADLLVDRGLSQTEVWRRQEILEDNLANFVKM